MKKKLITILTMSTLMLFGTFSTVLAAGDTKVVQPPYGDKSEDASIDLAASVDSTFIVKIPAKIDFGTLKKTPAGASDQYSIANITMNLSELSTGIKRVNVVSVEDNNNLALYHNGDTTDSKIKFVLTDMNGTKFTGSNTQVGFLDNKGIDTNICVIQVDKSTIEKGGKYTGTLNFEFTGVEC